MTAEGRREALQSRTRTCPLALEGLPGDGCLADCWGSGRLSRCSARPPAWRGGSGCSAARLSAGVAQRPDDGGNHIRTFRLGFGAIGLIIVDSLANTGVLAGGGELQPTRIFEWMRDWASRGLFHAIIPSERHQEETS